jgi:DNA repair protein RecO (recombination protein O)
VLMPFQRIAVSVSGSARDEASAEVRNLRSAEWAGGIPVRGGDALLSGFYLNELLLRLLARDDPHPQLWDAYAATLGRLGGDDEAPALRAFELVLLAETGHLPDLSRVTATSEAVTAGRHYLLRPEAGLVSAAADTPGGLDGAAWAQVQSAVASRDLDALRAACGGCEGALRRQLRQCLAYHLAGTTLHTRELVRDLQTLTAAR